MKNKNIENIISTHKFALYIIILLQAVSLFIIFLVLDNFFDSQTLIKDNLYSSNCCMTRICIKKFFRVLEQLQEAKSFKFLC